MEIYVQSCGKSVEQDYSWQKVVEGNILDNSDPPDFVDWSNKFVQKDVLSVFIGRKANELVLSISNIESNNRSDYVGRKARSSILCIIKNLDEEILIRSIAANALTDISTFSLKIDQAISFTPDGSGFQISSQDFQKFLLEDLIHAGQSSPSKECKIGNNSTELRTALAKEILQHKLPERQGVLVVVTQFQDPKVFKDAKVWRGLSSLVAEKTWQDIYPNPLVSIRSVIGGTGIFALMILIWIQFFSFPIQSGSYLILEDSSERIFLYSQPDTQAEKYQATPGTVIQVIEKRKQWMKVEICRLPRTELRSKSSFKELRWIPLNNLRVERKTYQILTEPVMDC